MTLRSLDIGTVVPRSGDAATGAALFGALTFAELDGETGATGAAATGLAAACTSSFLILPPTPVPLTLARFTPSSEANFLTIGVTYASDGCERFGAVGAGVATTGVTGATGAAGADGDLADPRHHVLPRGRAEPVDHLARPDRGDLRDPAHGDGSQRPHQVAAHEPLTPSEQAAAFDIATTSVSRKQLWRPLLERLGIFGSGDAVGKHRQV